MKIITEKLPKSLLSLQIELDKERLERGLDQAARRLSQKYPIHGFRPGKAPRFMIERTFGREALLEEASEDLINKAFRDALQQEKIEPVGPASLQGIDSPDPFTFTIHVPVQPTVDVGDYRAIRAPLEIDPVTDEQVERMMDVVRDRHVVLKELDDPRPAQDGDQLKVRLETVVDGEPLEPRPEGEETPEQTIDLVKGRLVDELYEGLIGANVGDTLEIAAQMPEDHGNEQVRGKDVSFKVEILGLQERLLPDWEDVPTLENFEGTLDELRAKTRADMETSARNAAERKVLDGYIEQLVAQTSYDFPDVMVHDLAHNLLHDQERQFSRYGITLDQMLQYRGQTHEEAIEALVPDAERQTKVTLALREIVRHEELNILQDEIEQEVDRLLLDYEEDQRPNVAQVLQSSQMINSVANSVLDRKLRERLIAIAIGTAPALGASAAEEPTLASDEDAEVQDGATETSTTAE
ncbi:MAG: trigger factor [Chloroflexales bacterium]|nr:trigger factor [Chloroflexales bacterium]